MSKKHLKQIRGAISRMTMQSPKESSRSTKTRKPRKPMPGRSACISLDDKSVTLLGTTVTAKQARNLAKYLIRAADYLEYIDENYFNYRGPK